MGIYKAGSLDSWVENVFTDFTIDDNNEHSGVEDGSGDISNICSARHLSLYIKFIDNGNSVPSSVRLRLYTGDDEKLGLSDYWDITDITLGDEIQIPIDYDVAPEYIKVTVENLDGSPDSNNCDVDVSVYMKR